MRPIFPIDKYDETPILFQKKIKKLVLVNISKSYKTLARKLKRSDQPLSILIHQCIPTLFANRFSLDETCILWDFIFDTNSVYMLEKIIHILSAIVITFEPIILNMHDFTILTLMQQKSMYNVNRIIAVANRLNLS